MYSSRMGPTWAAVRRPYTSSLIIMTGAKPQAPMHRQASRENSPSPVMPPGAMFSFYSTALSTSAAPLT